MPVHGQHFLRLDEWGRSALEADIVAPILDREGLWLNIKSVATLDKEVKGNKTLDRNLKFNTVDIDPKNVLPFRPVVDLEAQVKALGIRNFE